MTGLMIAFGTRPEVIKMAPIVKALKEHNQDFIMVHSGQHHDYNLSSQFIEELGLPSPDYNLQIWESSPGTQIGKTILGFDKIIKKDKVRLTLVEGDTNSVFAAAVAANKRNVDVGHVEAGLRSFDLRMPEEHNRRLVDHLSNILFAPTENAKNNLERENVWGDIYVTGNTVIDACLQYLPVAERKSRIMEEIGSEDYALATIHRAENVDHPEVLKNFVDTFLEAPLPIVLPAHPRTVERLRRFRLWKKLTTSKNVHLLPPVGYFDLLLLMKNCKVILTDSGGIQEEATAPPIRKPVLVLRTSTERPDAVEVGFAKVVGLKKCNILTAMIDTLKEEVTLPKTSPFGDGDSGEKIAEMIIEEYQC